MIGRAAYSESTPICAVGTDKQRRDDGGEEGQRDDRELVVLGIRGQLEVIGARRDRAQERGEHDQHRGRHERQGDQDPGRHLAADAAAEPERDAHAVAPDGAPPPPAARAFPVVALVAEVEDLGAAGRAHDAAASDGASNTLASE